MTIHAMVYEVLATMKSITGALLQSSMDTRAEDLRQAYIRMVQEDLKMLRELQLILIHRGWDTLVPARMDRIQKAVQEGQMVVTNGLPDFIV